MPRIYIEAASKEMKELPGNINQATIEFLPQLGHCLCIRSWLPPGAFLISLQIEMIFKSRGSVRLFFFLSFFWISSTLHHLRDEIDLQTRNVIDVI